MNKSAPPKYNDELQKQLRLLVQALQEFDGQQDKIYWRILALSRKKGVDLDKLKERLEDLKLPPSTANEILTIYSCPKTTAKCILGKMTIREAIWELRTRRKGRASRLSRREETIIRRALLEWGTQKQWGCKGKFWEMVFIPAKVAATSDSPPAAPTTPAAELPKTGATVPPLDAPRISLLLRPSEAKYLGRYCGGPGLSRRVVASELARRVLQPGLAVMAQERMAHHAEAISGLASKFENRPQ